MLSDTQIQDFENDLDLPFVGVFSKDRLPIERRAGDYYINLQNYDDGDGTHWTFFKIFDNGKAIYFDSFGVYMPEPVRDFLKPFAPVAVNNRQIQDLNAETCGHFCEACSYYMKYDFDKKKSINDNYYDFINMFSDNHKANNKILKEYLYNNSIKRNCSGCR
jgi:hypothetical protein